MSFFDFSFNEASKEDGDKLTHQGIRNHTVARSSNIANNIRKYNDIDEDDNVPRFILVNGRLKRNPEFVFNTNIGKEKERTRRQLLKDSMRASDGSIPNYGAKTAVSRDADPKAVKRFKKSRKYDNIDKEKTLENIDPNKREIVKRFLNRGSSLPRSIKDKLVKKEKIQPYENPSRYSNSYYNIGNGRPEKKELKKLFTRLNNTKDLKEHRKLIKEIAQRTGYDPKKLQGIKPGLGGDMHVFQKSKGETIKSTNNDTFYHTSSKKGLKELLPFIKSQDGVAYTTPRIYFNRNNVGGRVGGSQSIDEYKKNNSNEDIYSTKKPKQVHLDPELRGGSAVFFNTDKPLKVKQEGELIMDSFKDLMYDMILESLVNKVDNEEITIQEASIFSEAVFDELYTENLDEYQLPSQIEDMDPSIKKTAAKIKHFYHINIEYPTKLKEKIREMSDEELHQTIKDLNSFIKFTKGSKDIYYKLFKEELKYADVDEIEKLAIKSRNMMLDERERRFKIKK